MATFNDVLDILYSTQRKDLLEDFLVGITTPKERQEIARRLEVIQRILAGQPHAKIASDLGVGVATVTRGSKELAQGRFRLLTDPNTKEEEY